MERFTPEISVIMAVHNGEKFLQYTVDSILKQSFTSFELIVIDDASTDSTPDILNRYAQSDHRLRIVTNEENLKLARSLNKGLGLARGKYIARMDADDICLPDRFEKQYRFMEENSDIDVSSCKYFTLCDGVVTPCVLGRKCDSESIKAMFLFFCPILHPGVIAKAEVLKRYRYDPLHTCSEDLDLWTRMIADGVRFACSDDYLMLYRIHKNSITQSTADKQKVEVLQSERAYYSAMLSKLPSDEENFYINGVYFRHGGDIERFFRFYKFILTENRKKGLFKKNAVVSATTEVLAEYNRNFKMNFFDKLFMLRFGGFAFLAELIARKRQSKKDIAAAEMSARQAGLERLSGEIPTYKFLER